MQLKVGTAYKARNGERVQIVRNDGPQPCTFVGDCGSCYMSDGKYWDDPLSCYDLIAEWQDAPAPEVGKWIGWNGGECPVHPETVVEKISVVEGIGATKTHYGHLAGNLDWGEEGCYKIITPYVEPQAREFWVFVNGHGDTCVSKTWRRDSIHVREVLPDDE